MRCLALLSGGLDSMLAIRLMQEQRIEVEAVNFKTIFTCCQDTAAQSARDLGVRLTIVGQDDDYLDLIRKPMFGYGKGANPCIDCRIYMFERARRLLEPLDASFVVSGEVLGQRPKSQKRRDLKVIAHHSELDDLLLRPLSAKLLPATRPEREGWVDRERLYGFTGRSRKGLIELARRLGMRDIPAPSTGCSLTEVRFSRKVFDLLDYFPAAQRADFELLKLGRHFRYSGEAKVIVGRHEAENEHLERLFPGLASAAAILTGRDFFGPTVLLIGAESDDALDFAASLLVRYSRHAAEGAEVIIRTRAGERILQPKRTNDAWQAKSIAS
jgi:tRNA-uridine 2-sulfurtransferase